MLKLLSEVPSSTVPLFKAAHTSALDVEGAAWCILNESSISTVVLEEPTFFTIP